MARTLKGVILAAGRSTRFHSDKSKLLHEIAGRRLFDYTLDAVQGADPDEIVVVYGEMTEKLKDIYPDLTYVEQPEPLGTGHALQFAVDAVDAGDCDLLITSGDVPLLERATLQRFVDRYHEREAEMAVLSARLDDPSGYGRVILEGSQVRGIVEEKDADPDQKQIDRVNTGIYVMRMEDLEADLDNLERDNVQDEYYITDLVYERHAISFELADPREMTGVNNRHDLSKVESLVQERLRREFMIEGVTMEQPETVQLHQDVEIANDVVLRPGVSLRGETKIGKGSVVGPHSELTDTEVGADCRVMFTHAVGAEIGDGVRVGPFANLRPGTVVEEGCKIGNFVETKKARIREEAKVPHLSYVGDAEVGERSNIGAGTITCNYDGFNKHRTEIGKDVFIGSDTIIVAPCTIGDGAITGAGSVISEDVPAGALGIERNEQANIEGFAEDYREDKRESERDEQEEQTA